jgi:uncharacterized protein YozE (UPF0346 family)
MFTVPVSDILSSYTGDSKDFSFSGEVFDGFFDDIRFLSPLEFDIRLIALEDGVECIFEKFVVDVEYENKKHHVEITRFDRTWKKYLDPLEDPDDIREINMKNQTIDLAPVIREEIIMACHEL